MKQIDAFKLLVTFAERHNALIVSDIGSQSLWLKAVKDRPEHLYLSGPMGMASSVAMGVAAANPERLVMAACGDGALGMNLTSLATISNAAPKNLVVVVIDNGIYEFTRSLPSPTRGVNWGAIAKTFPGFRSNASITDIDKLDARNGPHFVHALVEPGELPPGPGLHPVDVHHRFKALLRSQRAGQTAQSC